MKNSKIEWTHHTFNPWWGCVKVSAGCKNCYAEIFSRRIGRDVWGAGKPRQFASDAYWREPYKWNNQALLAGERHRVFVASMGDIFENHPDEEIQRQMNEARRCLAQLIVKTPYLDWLLLTKRPENIELHSRSMFGRDILDVMRKQRNLWLGVSVENQEMANFRIPALLLAPNDIHDITAVRFVSIEPQLEAINLNRLENNYRDGYLVWDALNGMQRISDSTGYHIGYHIRKLDWVICGGESGANGRLFNPQWARSLRDQCKEAGVPFFMKQLGGHPNKRNRIEDLPEDLRIRDYPK